METKNAVIERTDKKREFASATAQPGESATIRAQVAPGRWEDVPRRSEANK